MLKLTNHLNREEAEKKIAVESFSRRTLSFYRYVRLDDPHAMRDELFAAWSALGVLGRVYVAEEGINAQVCVPEPNMDAFRTYIDSLKPFAGAPFKIGLEESITAFWKLTVKVRKQIVADNLPAGMYNIENVGNHLTAREFNEALDQGAIVVDMRNKYESDIGHFENAVTPAAQRFSDELTEVVETLEDKKDQKVLLYCTGGIRCEKASAFLKHNGFEDVNQLHGGIIDYKHQVEREGLSSKFIGKNFVFDNRMAETVTPDVLGKCYTCKQPADAYDNCKNYLCHALFIQCAACNETMLGTCSEPCKDVTVLPEEEKIQLRKGRKAEFKVLSS